MPESRLILSFMQRKLSILLNADSSASIFLSKLLPNFESSELKDLMIRLGFFAIGFSPIASVSLSTFGIVPLHISGPLVVFPAILLGFLICWMHRNYVRQVVEGLVAGIIAVTLYDLTRMPFLFVGMWPDFIPKIGSYLLNETDQQYSILHWIVGYLWRYIGNGGGMGLAFYMLFPYLKKDWDSRWVGTIYGIGIFCCLLATVYASPHGRIYLFDPSLLTGMLGLIGHVVYGFVLGTITEFLHLGADGRQKSFIVYRRMQLSMVATVTTVAMVACFINLVAFNIFFEGVIKFLPHSVATLDSDAIFLARRTYLTVLAVTNLFFIFILGAMNIISIDRIFSSYSAKASAPSSKDEPAIISGNENQLTNFRWEQQKSISSHRASVEALNLLSEREVF